MLINFRSVPFLRIVLPYIAGIAWAIQVGISPQLNLLTVSVFLLLIAAFLFQKYYAGARQAKKIIFIALSNVFLFLTAQQALHLYDASKQNNHYSHHITHGKQQLSAVIADVPVITENYTKLYVRINCIEGPQGWRAAEGNTIVYVKKGFAKELAVGQTLLIHSKFSYISEAKNPGGFDYKAFLQRKNIFQVVYASPDQCYIVPTTDPSFRIAEFGATMKEKVVSVLRSANLTQDAFSICTALLVGYDDEIDQQVMQSFSHSGTLHILSVSGMHTGVLYGVLVFLFSLIDKNDRYKKTKCAVVIVFLTLFAFITGFSPAVLRASLMLTLVLIGKTFYRQGNSYNTLLLSAFLLLLYNPWLITDIGFLLSYFAVFGIMYVYPLLSNVYFFENRVLQWLWSSSLISVAATLFTLPISLYYFHQFPTWFVLSNLVIIPLSMLLMMLAIVLIMFSKVVIIKQVLVFMCNKVTALMLWMAQLTDDPGYGYLDYIPFTATDLVFCSLLIIAGIFVFLTKQYKTVIGFAIIVAFWFISSIRDNVAQLQETELVVFHVKQQSWFAVRTGQTVYTNILDLMQPDVQRHVKPWLLKIANLKTVELKTNGVKVGNVCLVHMDKPGNYSNAAAVNYILVSNNVSPLNFLKNAKIKPLVIADCSNSYTFVKQLQQQCREAGIPFYPVKENGAFITKIP